MIISTILEAVMFVQLISLDTAVLNLYTTEPISEIKILSRISLFSLIRNRNNRHFVERSSVKISETDFF